MFNKLVNSIHLQHVGEVLSDPNWRAFKRQKFRAISSQITERNRQTVAAIKRASKCIQSKTSEHQPRFVRRRRRKFEKRLKRVQSQNPNFKFAMSTDVLV